MMKRREFMTLLGGMAGAALCPTARAEQNLATPTIGILGIGSAEYWLGAFRKGLNEQGFSEGRNVAIEIRMSAEAHHDRLRNLASDLVRHPVAVLIAAGSAGVAQAAKAATTTIPIVFANGSDPVRVGLVTSMNRPGGNATGISFFTSNLGPKRLELLRELVPKASRIAFLVNPINPVTEGDIKDMENAARSVGQRIFIVRASNKNEIDAAFATVAREQAGALLVNVDAFFASQRNQLAGLAIRYRIPTSYNNGQYVRAGGLMSYGDNRLDSYRKVGVYAGRILKGERPIELPVEQPTKFEMLVNLKAAKAIGLTIPEAFLVRADEIIE